MPLWDFETICQNITAPRSVGVQQNKNSGTRITEQTVDTTTNEGSKTMGRGFLSRGFFFPLHLSGRDAMRQEARLCFPVFPPWSQYHLTVVIRGDWCHCSPLSNETCHTQGAIWSSLPPPLSIVFSVRSPTCYLCEQRFCLLCIFIVYITGRKPG